MQVLAGCVLMGGAPATAHGQALPAAAPAIRTPAEAADYLAYTSPDTALAWLQELAREAGPIVSVRPLITLPGEYGGRPVVVPAARISSAAPDGSAAGSADGARIRVLLFGSQHGDERAGYEVALRMARDLSIGELRPLLDRLEVVIVPVVNPIGMRAGTRFDASGEDPNRDHLMLASPVNRALWELHAEFEPHLVLDMHEMGPTPYEAQIGLPTHPNVDPRLTELARYWLLPYVVRALAEADVRFHEYISEVPDPAYPTAIEAPADTFFTWAPINASNARNAFSLAGSLGLLLETASGQEIDDLKRRTDRLHLVVRSLLEVTAGLSDEVLARVWNTPDRRDAPTPFLALQAENEADPEQPFLRWLRRNEMGNLVPMRIDRWRPGVRVSASLPLPAAWVILPEGAALAAHLEHHGIRMRRLIEPVELEVSEYRTPVSVVPGRRTLSAGSWVVPAEQPRQRLLFTLVEPGSDDGWIRSPPPGLAAAGWAESDLPLVRIEGRLPALPLVSADAIGLPGVAPNATPGREPGR
jgi:hypothetical protein